MVETKYGPEKEQMKFQNKTKNTTHNMLHVWNKL